MFVSVGHRGRGVRVYTHNPPPGQNLTDDVDRYGPKGSLLGDSHPNSDYPFVLRRAGITFAWARAALVGMGHEVTKLDELRDLFNDTFPVKVDESDPYGWLVFLVGDRCVLCKYPYPSVSCERSCPANARHSDRTNLVPG